MNTNTYTDFKRGLICIVSICEQAVVSVLWSACETLAFRLSNNAAASQYSFDPQSNSVKKRSDTTPVRHMRRLLTLFDNMDLLHR